MRLMRLFWLLVESSKLFLVFGALVAPFAGLAAGAILGRNLTDGAKRGRRALRGFVTGLVLAPVMLWFGMCSPPPGEGRAAEQGRQRADVVVQALQKYRVARGAFPDSLIQLVPQFLSAQELLTPFGHSKTFQFRLDTLGFALTFDYVGPGMNACEYSSWTMRWSCSGYF